MRSVEYAAARGLISGVFFAIAITGAAIFGPRIEVWVAPCVHSFEIASWRDAGNGVWGFNPVLNKADRCGKPVDGSIGWAVRLSNGEVRSVPMQTPTDLEGKPYNLNPSGVQRQGEWMVDFSSYPDAVENFGTVVHKPGFWELKTILGPFKMPE